ncbi:MAG: ParB/RepB/Spo0J family partition protein [Dehalococcoidia bacterium]
MNSTRPQPKYPLERVDVGDREVLAITTKRPARPDLAASLLPIDQIHPDPDQPYRSVSRRRLDDQIRSIEEAGSLNPVIVRRVEEGYLLISGEPRLRAAREAGLREISALVRDLDEEKAFVAGLIEDLQRENIPPEEEAVAFDELMRLRGFGVRELARQIHKDPSYVSRRVRVYEDVELGEAVRSGRMAVSTAERVLSIRSQEVRGLIRQRAIDGDRPTDPPGPSGENADPRPEISPAARAISAIETLLAAPVRPTNEERRRLKALSDDLLNWVFRYGPLPWS